MRRKKTLFFFLFVGFTAQTDVHNNFHDFPQNWILYYVNSMRRYGAFVCFFMHLETNILNMMQKLFVQKNGHKESILEKNIDSLCAHKITVSLAERYTY